MIRTLIEDVNTSDGNISLNLWTVLLVLAIIALLVYLFRLRR